MRSRCGRRVKVSSDSGGPSASRRVAGSRAGAQALRPVEEIGSLLINNRYARSDRR